MGLRVEDKKAVVFNSFFLLRRMLYVYALSFLAEFRLAQIAVVNLGSLSILGYIIEVNPFSTSLMNFIELLNEAFILGLSYFCFIFTDLQSDYALKFELGWIYVLLIAA